MKHHVTYIDPATGRNFSLDYDDADPEILWFTGGLEYRLVIPYPALLVLLTTYHLDVAVDHLEHRPLKG